MLFGRTPRPPRDLANRALLAFAAQIDGLRRDLSRNTHDLHLLKESIMSTKAEVLAEIAEVKTLMLETGKDVNRVADKLDQAVAGGDLSEVSAAVAELRGIAQGIDDRAEASDPEQVDEEPADEPAEDETTPQV